MFLILWVFVVFTFMDGSATARIIADKNIGCNG